MHARDMHRSPSASVNASTCVCKYVCACVTDVQRGPARGTEFKFQIWSVSQGVTVCIALPAGSNSFHRWCVFDPSASLLLSTPCSAVLCARDPPPFSLFESTQDVSSGSSYSFHLSIHLDFSYYSNERGIWSYRSAKGVTRLNVSD